MVQLLKWWGEDIPFAGGVQAFGGVLILGGLTTVGEEGSLARFPVMEGVPRESNR
jgi:hypothetical protein